jgi:meso-butanediol dehydrogenase/(S,S)-butanediol dehydrogenase/diacetyl reductase
MILENRIIVITGAGRGMGRGIAEACADRGAAVLVCDVDLDAVRETAQIISDTGQRALACSLDVTQRDQIEGAIARAVETFGRVDGWVNNAGVVKMDSALDTSIQDSDWQFRVNVSGLFLCCQLAAKQMRETGGGAIVNIASNAGKVGYNNMAAYNASKAAVINLTRSLSNEWAEYNINVNAVCPGGVNTPMLLSVAEFYASRFGGDPHEMVKTFKPKQLAHRIEPIQVGRVVAFLLSDDAYIIRGQSINIDGGDTPY